MTAEQIQQKAIEHRKKYQQRPEGYNMDSSAEDGYIAGANMILESPEYKQLKYSAEKWEELKKRLSDMLENYTGEERDSTMKQEIVTETHWIVTMLTKYEVNW